MGIGYELQGYVALTGHVLQLFPVQLSSSRAVVIHPRVVLPPTDLTKQYAPSAVGAGHRVPAIFVGSCRQLLFPMSDVHVMHLWSILARLLQ